MKLPLKPYATWLVWILHLLDDVLDHVQGHTPQHCDMILLKHCLTWQKRTLNQIRIPSDCSTTPSRSPYVDQYDRRTYQPQVPVATSQWLVQLPEVPWVAWLVKLKMVTWS